MGKIEDIAKKNKFNSGQTSSELRNHSVPIVLIEMKTILLLIMIFSFSNLLSQTGEKLFISVIDELKIPIDTISATVYFKSREKQLYTTNNGKLILDISTSDTAIIEFEREQDFYGGILGSLKLPISTVCNENNKLIVELTASESINHGFYRLDLDKTFTSSDILNLPDTISFYDYATGYYQQKKSFVQIDSIDSSLYTFRLIDPNRKVLVQGADYNQQMNVKLNENDSVTLTIGGNEKKYYVIGYGTYRGFEWRLINEE